tara:strand:+ start:1692 stop:2357 length:666 start_codon:yes stop_codon:yes gene_type:complete
MYKYKKSKYLILVPAFNELKNLKHFVKKINNLAPLYILDDCSEDRTENWLISNKIKYMKNKKNLGYEKNLLNGIKKFKSHCEYLITFDGDGQHKVSDLKKIINFNKNYDIIICNRKNKNRFLEEIISFFSYLFFNLKDPLSGFKVYKTKILSEADFKKNENLFLVDFLLSFITKNSSVYNYEINTKKRIGKSKVGGMISISLKEIRIIFKLFLIKFNLIKP